MLLENSQTIIEVILILVIVAGIISSRLIVKRLGVIRETYAALNDMVANLDTSTDHVGRVFDAMKHEANKGGKRLNTLVEHARNAGEDLTDLQKMAREVMAELEQDVAKAEAKEAALVAAIRQAEKALQLVEEQAAVYRDLPSPETLKAQYEETLKEAEKRARDAFTPVSPHTVNGSTTVSFHPKIEESLVESSAESDKDVTDNSAFRDVLEPRSVPHALRSPRPYMKALEDP